MRINLSKHGVAAPLLAGLVLAAIALWFRHGLLEAGLLPRDCTLADAPWAACVFKDALVQTFLHQRVGWVSLVAGVLPFAPPGPPPAWGGWLSRGARLGPSTSGPAPGRRP